MSRKLRGQDLLDYVKANQGVPEKELAAGAGYYTDLPDGGQQVNTKPFYQELSLAMGVVAPTTLGKKTRSGGGSGRGLAYNLKTNERSGNAVVTGGYLRQIGVHPGQRVSVEIVEEAAELVLKLAEDPSEASAEVEEEVPALV